MTCAICAALTSAALCPPCAETLARLTGAIEGGLVPPYFQHYARHQAAFKKMRDTCAGA